ncbi:MAG: nucleoside monophosphate kinase [Nanoarchaeota archaeon]|nr:nucleoside monophosphate kinase [Nanoarchaeota archaeon]
MRLVITGPPGTGKGTQAELLAKKHGLKIISAGKLLRDEVKKQTRLGRKVAKIINRGDLVPDGIVNKIIKARIKRNQDNIIFDGFPRDIKQAKKFGKEVDLLILIKSSKASIIKRLLKRKRKDDIIRTIKHRIVLYKEKTEPVINHFKNKKIPIIKINGNQTPAKVHKEIMKKLKAILRDKNDKIQVC